MKRSRLRAQSSTRAGEHDQREAVRADAKARDGDRCALTGYSPCWHPRGERLDCHEAPRRGQWPGAHLDAGLCMLLCRRHHDLEDDAPNHAERIGIRVPREVMAANRQKALEEMAALRSFACRYQRPGHPYWREPEWGGVDADASEESASG